jgi:indoleamine 2,3-dioxygenase
MQPIETYEINEERGYLCQYDADKIKLSGDLLTARQVAMELPRYLPSGRVRRLLRDALPQHDLTDALVNCDEAQARMAMVHYSFMVQAWVWGEETPSDHLPACLSKPIVTLADRLGQQPLLPYSGYVLDNWARFDPDGPIDLDNIYMIQNFLSGMDEAWFVLIHVAIEAKAGGVLARMPSVIQAVESGDEARAAELLEEMATIWREINAIFDRMPERCDPYMYFNRVRPYIHGWKDNPALPNGVIYEGVARYSEGQAFRGQTGSQSSIVPAMDALMGVGHAADPMKAYLDQLHIYRPPAHRAFIDDLRAESSLREFVSIAQNAALTDAYNANVQAVADFRSRHLEYAASYINKQALDGDGNHTDVGTGGTPFMRYLKKHRDETRARLLPMPKQRVAI